MDRLSFIMSRIGIFTNVIIPLFVMYKTFQNTKRENVHEYENRWLDDFRGKCAAFIDVFNINNVITIINEMALTPDLAYEHCGDYINRLMIEETIIALICEDNQDEKLAELYERLKVIQNGYRKMFNSIHAVVCCVRNIEKKPSFDGRMALIDSSLLESNSNLKDMIKANLDDDGKIAVSKLHRVLLLWIDNWENTYSEISNLLKQYIVEKQEEINRNYQKI